MLLVCPTAQAKIQDRYLDLIKFIQPAPNQGETNTCWFMASTGAMELLLNKKHDIQWPKKNGPYDLSESFAIHQYDYWDAEDPQEHFLENIIARFNHGEAIHHKHWPIPLLEDGSADWGVWNLHPEFSTLPRMKVPSLKSELLFARGRRWATNVLSAADISLMKETLALRKSPLIVNYNDDGYWHVVLIVGYNDEAKGVCYELEPHECNPKGAFVVRDSDGMNYELRAYNWFLKKGNAAAVVELK